MTMRETDEEWDEFLWSCPRGQFQQTSGWARAKAVEGWSAERVYLSPGAPRHGGFQILVRQTRFGRAGFVNKGPVLPEESDAAIEAALDAVVRRSRELGLRGVVLQPPDNSRIRPEHLQRSGFFDQPLAGVTRTTAMADLSGGREAVLARMSRTTRNNWRAARRRGVSWRFGSHADLAMFFGLMEESCRRQHSLPKPRSAEALLGIWDGLAGRVHLALAESDGRLLCGLLLIRHSDRMTLWKKGWSSAGSDSFPNVLLNVECLLWAAEQGCTHADFVGMSPEVASAVLTGESPSEHLLAARDWFNLRLGAMPRLLPAAQLLVPNPYLRVAGRLVMRTVAHAIPLIG